MMMRMKATYYFGKSKNGIILADDPVLPGCANYKERLELKNLRGKLKDDEYEKRKEKLYGSMKRTKTSAAPEMIKMHLKHGDMVVMHGAEMQKYYEVSAISGP